MDIARALMNRSAPTPDGGHFIVINRWRENYADYAHYIDHSRNNVSYVTTADASNGIPGKACGVTMVESLDDASIVRSAVADLVTQHGQPVGIVGLHEKDLLIAADLREEYNVKGPTKAEVLPFRDKAVMYALTKPSGVPQPAFAVVTEKDQVADFGNQHGWPVVVKPRDGAGSANVMVIASSAALADLPSSLHNMLVQAYEDAPIYHFDGYFDGSRAAGRLSRYINNCFDFRFHSNTALGSVEEDSPSINEAACAAAQRILSALTTRPAVFHLELFGREAGGEMEFSFLEVGGRVGGAETPLLWREVHGADLMQIMTDLQLGSVPQAPVIVPRPPWCGYLIVPTPAQRPCRITRASSLMGQIPTLYAESGPQVGDLVPSGASFYEHVGGRFRFRGVSTAAMEKDIIMTAERYEVEALPLGND